MSEIRDSRTMKQVWACGGGTQSAAIAGLIYEGKLPNPDCSLMVDTEREKSSTWRYVYGTIKPKLAEVGVDLVVIPKSQYATVDLYSKKDTDLLIPAFTTQSGQLGKLPTYCSNEWKVRVMDRWLRERGVAKTDAMTWKGISTDELDRVKTGRNRYVLIFEHPMNRAACRHYVVQRLGWPAPPNGGSACWFCPNMADAQWVEIRDNDPEDFEKACVEDEALRRRDPHVFVHSSGRPLREVAAELDNPNQVRLFGDNPSGCDSGVCFV